MRMNRPQIQRTKTAEVGRRRRTSRRSSSRPNSAIAAPYDSIVVCARRWRQERLEVELAAVIGREARKVSEADALKHVAAIASSTTSPSEGGGPRGIPMERGGTRPPGQESPTRLAPIGRGSSPTTGPADPQALEIVDHGQRRAAHARHTKDMIFAVRTLVAT